MSKWRPNQIILFRKESCILKNRVLSINLLKFYDSSHLFSWAVMVLLLLIMNILIIITLTVDLLVAHCCMSCSAGVSFHPTFSPAKWPTLPVIGRWCLWECGQSAPHSTGWQPQSQPCSCCASLKKASVSSYKFADVFFHFHQMGQSPSTVSFPICSCLPCTPRWELAGKVSSPFESLLAFWTRSLRARCSQAVKTWCSPETWLYQVRTFLFSRYELFLINSFQKGERKAKLVWS